MKATLILADAARVHPDGTFSLLRGGITRLWVVPGQPAALRGTILVRFMPSLGEKGEHKFAVSCMDQDGTAIGAELSGSFQIPQGKTHPFQLHLDLNFIFPKLGTYVFYLIVDDNEADTWKLEALERPKEQTGGKEE